jgi:amino acid transporter
MPNKLISSLESIKRFFIGKSLNPTDSGMLHHVSLIAFFAWVGLGADGLSSSVYGPAEAYSVLHNFPYLAIFVGLASVFTIFVISQSYSQIIEKFPNGGGGYVVATKLLSPTLGMISGCALLIDYILTITISIASGADAIFSFFPLEYHPLKIWVGLAGITILIILNLRGVKESVTPLVPIFLTFVITHAFVILYAVFGHLSNVPETVNATFNEVSKASAQMGVLGMLALILKGYSMGAGTYTGIEAISNGVGILREPKVKTAKKTMSYMTWSLSFMVLGLMLAYIFFNVKPEAGKTLNALLLDGITLGWPAPWGHIFALVTLVSEAAILFVAAQTGFFDGPRVLSNMALDRWFPSKFAMLSDRLVTQKGVLMMGIAAMITFVLTHGSVEFLIVLYSINVFITFALSQLGMTRYWIEKRKQLDHWMRKFAINFLGLILTLGILTSMVILKFDHGGWITLAITGSLVLVMLLIKRHYIQTAVSLRKLDKIMSVINTPEYIPSHPTDTRAVCNPAARTAVLFVNGFTGLGLHTLSAVHKSFPGIFDNFLFVQISLIDAGVFKGQEEMGRLQKKSSVEINKYVDLMKSYGYYAEGIAVSGVDIVEEISNITPKILERFPSTIFFGGQLVFPEDSLFTKWLHNSVVFTVQERLYKKGIPFMILPVRV